MKTVFIGDVHGRDVWKQIIEQEKPDRVVFIGDYFDSFNKSAAQQMHNFKEIIAYKESNQAEVILLVGNHDYHYMDVDDEGTYSGYQAGPNGMAIKILLKENMHHLQMAHMEGEWLCTHAGVTKTFCELHGLNTEDYAPSLGFTIAEQVNELFKYHPNDFGFNGMDGYGDDKTQGPLWVRPKSLFEDMIHCNQIVGHTGVRTLVHPSRTAAEHPYVFYLIDTQDASRTYLILENGVMSIRTTTPE